jgi:hypothetical protein
MPTIKFATNQPVELRLRSIEGRPVESQFGGTQHMFSAEEGVFYVSETVGGILTDQLRKLRIQPGDLVEIIKAETVQGNRKRIEWQVAQVGYYPGEQPDGTFAVPAPPPAERKEPQQAPVAAPPAWASALVDQTCVLVDAFAAVVKHSAQYGGIVKPEDARSIMLSAYINLAKSGGNGGRNAA